MNDTCKAGRSYVTDWLVAILRVSLRYRRAHKRLPNLIAPRRFSEKIQWRKLFDLDERYISLCDKLSVRDFIESRVGIDHVIPCLWVGDEPENIPYDKLSAPYIIKSTHGSGHVCIVGRDDDVDRKSILELTRSWLQHCHGIVSHEPGYIPVPRRLIIEKLLNLKGEAPLEVKAYVFDGRVRTFQTIAIDAQTRERFRFHSTADWMPLPWVLSGESPLADPVPRPQNLDEVVRMAEALGSGFEHVRVDMYLCDHLIYVGEITLYSQSGLLPFDPDEADYLLGAYWQLRHPLRRALQSMSAGLWEIRTS